MDVCARELASSDAYGFAESKKDLHAFSASVPGRVSEAAMRGRLQPDTRSDRRLSVKFPAKCAIF